jgi:hypothetical protein
MPRFCFFIGVCVFNGIQASFAGLFDAKKNEPFGEGGPVPIFTGSRDKTCAK